MSQIIVIEAVTPTGTGVTGASYWNRLADELGTYLETVTSDVASGGDPNRVVLADELQDDEKAYQFLPTWLYVRPTALDGAVQRRILKDNDVGYQGNQALLTVSRPFDSALSSGRTIVATNPLPVFRHLGIPGLREFTNQALARIWVRARAAVTGNGTYEYDLATLPSVADPDQIDSLDDSIYYGSTFPAEQSVFGYRIVQDGVTRTLVTDTVYSSADTFYLNLFVRADRLVYDGSAWSLIPDNVTAGLQTEAYQAVPPIDMVVAFAMVKALQFVRRQLISDQKMDKQERSLQLNENGRRLMTYARMSARIRREQFPRPIAKASKGLVAFGGFRTTWY